MTKLTRLSRWMRNVACLSETEVICAINGWQSRHDDWSSEAVNHFGGFLMCLKYARMAHSQHYGRREAWGMSDTYARKVQP